ncbi:MAG: cytochrome C oxidase subunit IV family protein [Anaerolineales bacterium]|nr:cytochrome C oxidase subunit IV family protein [Anaerolineales bacterium]
MNGNRAKAMRRGLITFLALLVLTVVEYFIGIQANASIVLLFVIALVKAALIVQVFMHISRLWREEEH